MNAITQFKLAIWQQDGADWCLIVGNQTVAKIIPNVWKQYNWLSVMEPEFESSDWHAVDFETLDGAKCTIGRWWMYHCQGKSYRHGDEDDPEED